MPAAPIQAAFLKRIGAPDLAPATSPFDPGSQFALLDHFGHAVQLCNVRLEELLRVEIYRRGLHADAFAKPRLKLPGVASTSVAAAAAG